MSNLDAFGRTIRAAAKKEAQRARQFCKPNEHTPGKEIHVAAIMNEPRDWRICTKCGVYLPA